MPVNSAPLFRHRRFSEEPLTRRNVARRINTMKKAFDPPIGARGLKSGLYRAGPDLRPHFHRDIINLTQPSRRNARRAPTPGKSAMAKLTPCPVHRTAYPYRCRRNYIQRSGDAASHLRGPIPLPWAEQCYRSARAILARVSVAPCRQGRDAPIPTTPAARFLFWLWIVFCRCFDEFDNFQPPSLVFDFYKRSDQSQ